MVKSLVIEMVSHSKVSKTYRKLNGIKKYMLCPEFHRSHTLTLKLSVETGHSTP